MMNKRQLRKFFREIYESKNEKLLPEEELIKLIMEKGYNKEKAQELYTKALDLKILQIGFVPKIDKKTGKKEGYIVVEYMTADDWAALRAVEKATEPEEDLKWLLHEWDNVPPKEREKKLKEIFRKLKRI